MSSRVIGDGGVEPIGSVTMEEGGCDIEKGTITSEC